MGIKQDIDAKYGGKKAAAPASSGQTLRVVSSPYEPAPIGSSGNVKAEIDAKYGGGKPQPKGPQIVSVGPAQDNRTIVVDRSNQPPARTDVDLPLSFFDKLKKALGFKVEPKKALVFNLDEKTSQKVARDSALFNYNERQLKRAISADVTVEEAKLMGNTPYEYDRLGQLFLTGVANAIIPKSLQRLAASPGSIADQSLSGLLEPENLAEQVATYSGSTLGSAMLFSVAQPMVVSQLGKVPGFVSFAQNYPRTANIIAGALSFAGAGAVSDAIQEKSPGEIIKNVPGNLLTGGGFGAGGPLKVVVPTVFGTSFLGAKLQGESNTAALTSAALNSIFAGGQKFMEAGDVGKLRDVAQTNAFKTLGLKENATSEQIKASYRALAHKAHPDRGGNASDFVKIQAAYEIAKSSPAQREGLVAEWTRLYQDIKAGKNPFEVPRALPAGQPAEAPVVAQEAPQTTSVVPSTGRFVQTPPGQAASSVSPGRTVAQLSQELLSEQEVKTIMDTKLDPKVVEKIRSLEPEQQLTFGRQIESTVRDVFEPSSGGDASGKLSGYEFTNQKLSSGAPAEFQADGSITVSIPQLISDIQALSEGSRIAAHPNTPYATVYEKKDGETINQLTARYVSDVILHEASHVRTVSQADFQRGQDLQMKINEAVASGNQKIATNARTDFDKHLLELENRANQYLLDNREALTAELFPQLKFVLNKFKTQAAEVKTYKQRFVRSMRERFQKNMMRDKIVTQRREAVQKVKDKASEKLAEVRSKMRTERDAKVEKEKTEVKTRYENAITKIQDRQSTIQDRKQELYEYAKLVPASARGKFLGAIKNTTTQKEFLEVLERMRKATNAVQRRVLIQEITKELKTTKAKKQAGVLKGKFTADTQRRLDGIRANLKNSYEISRSKRNDIIASWRDEHGDAPLPVEILIKLEDLAMQGITEMDTKELRFTLDNIQSLKETGRTKNELAKFNRETRIELTKEKISDIITGGQELPSNSQSLPSRTKTSNIEKFKSFFTTQQFGWEELLDKLSFYDKGSQPYESFLSRFGRKAHTSNSTEYAGQTMEIMKGDKALRDIYKFKKNSEVMAFINDSNVAIELGKYLHEDGVMRDLTLTRGEAMYFTALMENPNLTETFEKGMNWTPEIKDAVKSILTEQDFKMVEWLMKDLQDYYPSINEVYSRENFVDLPFDEKYFPLYRQVEKIQKKEAEAGTVSQLLSEEAKYYASVKNGSLKSRTANAVPVEPKHILDVWFTHKIKMEHYKAWATTMYDFRRIFGDPEVRQAITDFHGREVNKVIDNFLNDMARGGVDQAKQYQFWDKLRRNVTRSILGLNVKVSSRQLLGVINYMVEMPSADFFSGVADFYSSPLQKGRELYESSPILQERFGEGYERDIRMALQAGYAEKLSKAKSVDKYFFYLIRNADRLTVMPGVWAAYRSKYLQLQRQGVPPAEAKAQAIEHAEIITNRIQESSQLDTLSPLQRGGTFYKLLTMFQSQPNKFWRIANNSIRNIRAGRGSKANHLKRLAMVWLILPSLWQLAVNGFKWDKKDQARTALLGPFSYPLIAGQFFQSAVGWLSGQKYPYQASPLLSIPQDVGQSLQQLSTGDFTDGITYLIDAMGKSFGIPTGFVTKPIRKEHKDEEKGSTTKVKF